MHNSHHAVKRGTKQLILVKSPQPNHPAWSMSSATCKSSYQEDAPWHWLPVCLIAEPQEGRCPPAQMSQTYNEAQMKKYPKIHSTISKVCRGLINKLTFRFLQSNGQQLVPLRMPSYLNRARRLVGSIFICNSMSSTRAAYQGTEGRCQGRWGPQSLARWCNGSAKPLSPPLYPGGLT